MAKPVHVGQSNFETEVLQAQQPVLVDFYADWCGPCRAIAPIIEEIARDLDGRLEVAKLDVDANNEISMKYGVQSIPTLILFREGKEVERVIGFVSKAQLVKMLEQHLIPVA